jgi:heme/copper-type cytochrome/quinol oxidase subunit 4
MNVTRDVISDLLPIYYSGEASADSKALVEEYFRQYPDFERTARNAAQPLETLRSLTPLSICAEKEKRGLETVRWQLRRRMVLFSLSAFLTLVPLSFHFTGGHIVSLMVRDAPWEAAFYWSLAVLGWFLYVARLNRRTASFVAAIFLTLIPIPFVWHSVFVGEPLGSVPFIVWMNAAVVWIGHFRQPRC